MALVTPLFLPQPYFVVFHLLHLLNFLTQFKVSVAALSLVQVGMKYASVCPYHGLCLLLPFTPANRKSGYSTPKLHLKSSTASHLILCYPSPEVGNIWPMGHVRPMK